MGVPARADSAAPTSSGSSGRASSTLPLRTIWFMLLLGPALSSVPACTITCSSRRMPSSMSKWVVSPLAVFSRRFSKAAKPFFPARTVYSPGSGPLSR